MSKKLYVGNMSYNTTNEELQQLFSEYGTISEVKIITDQISNRSKGFGFVTFEDANSCQGAIDALNGFEFNGRTLKVNIAEDRAKKRDFSHGGGGGGGGNNNRRRY
jgi:RNA recognition motif-containing protein